MNDSPTYIHKGEKLPKCGICRNVISDRSIHQSDPSLPIICSNCHENFTGDEVFLMTNLFVVYGGYFGQKRSTEFSFINSLKTSYKDQFSMQDFEEINAQFYHNALLHGISLQECSNKLKRFLDSM
jgi:hypothetical protein